MATVILGSQFGDEGKLLWGKHLLDGVVRLMMWFREGEIVRYSVGGE